MFKEGGIIWKGGVDYVSVAYSGSEGGTFWKDCRLYGSVAYLRGGGIFSEGGVDFWEGRIDSGSVTYSCRKGGYILKGRGRLWECRI